MSKITLNNVGSLIDNTTASNTININSNTIQTAFDNTLSRDGSTPNQMENNFDMNGFQILNLPAPLSADAPLRLTDLNTFNGGGTIEAIPAGGTTGQALAKTSNIDYAVGWENVVSSVGLSLPGGDFTITNSPVTSSGTLTATWTTTPTGTGAMVRSTSPTFVTPLLGTPTSGVLTNCTGLPLASVTGFATGVATFLATPTSANLVAAVTDETGTGKLVFGTSPTIATPTITGALTYGGVTLAAAVAGTGNLVASISPTITTPTLSSPVLGTATATSLGIVNTSAKTFLDINANVSSSPALVVSTSLSRFQSVDAANSGFEMVSYGAPNGNFLSGAVASGTSVSPTATVSGLNMFNIRGFGYNGSSFQVGGIVTMGASTTWSGTNQGTSIQFFTTPDTSVTIARAGGFASSGGFNVGVTNDPGVGGILAAGSMKSASPTAGIGYITGLGAGGAVTQITSRNTGVTLNNITGAITLVSALNAAVSGATANSITVTNSSVTATDIIHVSQKSGTDLYLIFVTAVAAGSFKITFYTTGGTSTEQPVFNFAVIKGSAN